MDQARYATVVVAKHLDTEKLKENFKFDNTTLIHDTVFTKEDASISDKQVEVLSREYRIHYRTCVGSLTYPLYQRVDFRFALHKLDYFSSNTGKLHFEGLVHLLI